MFRNLLMSSFSQMASRQGETPSMSNTLGSALLVLLKDSIPEAAERELKSNRYDATVETD